MPIRFACPHCGQSLRARDDKVGRKLKCPKCRQTLTVPAEAPSSGEAASGAAEEDPYSELIVYDDEIIYETEEPPGAAPPRAASDDEDAFDPQRVAVPRWMLYAHAGLLALLAGLAFWLGMVMGGGDRDGETTAAAPERPVEIAGRLTWVSVTGEIADKDAVVIILPPDSKPQDKIQAASLTVDKPAPKSEDQALQEIEALGGQYKRTQEGGRFYVNVVPGTYRVLLISRNAQLPAKTFPNPDDVAKLGAVFLSPETILGQQKYLLTTMDLNGKSEIKHNFGESGKP